jgi:polar amino acid transport system substrate-binding protein
MAEGGRGLGMSREIIGCSPLQNTISKVKRWCDMSRHKMFVFLSLFFLSVCHLSAQIDWRKELLPTGKLRVGIAIAPVGSAFWATRDPESGNPRGVTPDLASELAKELGVQLELVILPNSGEIVASRAWDVTFLPVDAERETQVAFGPAYYMFESTYLVTAKSNISNIAEVDRPGVRVVGIGNTTTARAAARSLKQTTVIAAQTVEQIEAMLRSGEADAAALGRDSLLSLAKRLPGTRILDGNFQRTGVAIAVPKNRPAALKYVSEFIERAKASGAVQRALDRAGIMGKAAAPVSRRP